MTIELNTSRIDSEMKRKEDRYKLFKEFHKEAIIAAKRFIKRLEPSLKKRGIKIASSQMYFNEVTSYDIPRALVHLNFSKRFSEHWDSKKTKNLEKELKDLKIPMPIHGVTDSIVITIYDETINW